MFLQYTCRQAAAVRLPLQNPLQYLKLFEQKLQKNPRAGQHYIPIHILHCLVVTSGRSIQCRRMSVQCAREGDEVYAFATFAANRNTCPEVPIQQLPLCSYPSPLSLVRK